MKTPFTATALAALAYAVFTLPASALEHGHADDGAEGVFLRSDRHRLPLAAEQELSIVDGAYGKSARGTPRERIDEATLLVDGKKHTLETLAWREEAQASYLKFTAGEAAGTVVIGLSLRPQIIERPTTEMPPSAQRKASLHPVSQDEDRSTVRERRVHFTRTILQVGESPSSDYALPLGHSIEILLDKNPATTPFGQDMTFRVLLEGKPLANQLVEAGYDAYHEHDDYGAHLDALPLRTDAEGRATFNLALDTPWYIALVHTRKLDGAEADYETIGASLTFDTRL